MTDKILPASSAQNMLDKQKSADQELSNLLKRARAGDASAFDKLFVRHRAELRRFIDMRLDPRIRKRIDASDIVQDTHIEAFRRFNHFFDNRPMPFTIWLRKNAYERLLNVQRDHLKTAKRSVHRERQLPDQSSIMIAHQICRATGTASEQLAAKEFKGQVFEIIAQLSSRDQEIILMRNVESLSHQDIAHLLGIEPATARKRYARALLRLEQLLINSGITG